jgi:DNA modification methylase
MRREDVSFRREVLAEGVEVYLGDCREILPALGTFDALVTDPPYGINITKSNRLAVSRGMGGKTWDDAPADAETIALLRSAAKDQIIWGGNYFDLPPTRAPLVWDKNNAGRDFADFEMAWTNLDMVARRFIFRPMNMDGGKEHPTQKPIEVMSWCLDFLPPRQRVIDPFMGSGTTGISCVKRGHAFTGIEIDPGYFDLACSRINKALLEPDMFIAPPKPPEQLSILTDEKAA